MDDSDRVPTMQRHDLEPQSLTSDPSDLDPHKIESEKRKLQTSSLIKFSVFVGIFMVRILDGIPWVWGNLGVYVTSFYYVKGDDSSASATNWLISIDSFGFNIGLLFGGLVAKKIGIRLTLLLSIIVFNGSIALTYFTVKHSAIALCTTFGALAGISGGMIENCQLTLIVRWTNRYQGLSSTSVPSSNILGAVVINLILTMFINPTNEVTNATRDKVDIFTQPELINRVPYSFVLYGLMSFTLNIVGFFLVRINKGDNNIIYDIFVRHRSTDCSEDHEKCKLRCKKKPANAGYESLHDVKETKCLSHETEAKIETALMNGTTEGVGNDSSNLHVTPLGALKTRAFYALWIFSVMLNYAFFVLNTYYKAFGLLYIPDDHFLTVVVMVKCFVTPVCTWFAGFSVDKFGVKPTMVSVTSIFCIVASLFYLTAVDRWLYMFSTVLYGCALFSLFCLTSACCVKLFGQTHFSTIFGMVLTSSNVLVLAVPTFTEWIISTQSWLFLFSSVGVLACCQVLVLVFGLPGKQPF